MAKIYASLFFTVFILSALSNKSVAQAFKLVRDINNQRDGTPSNVQVHTNSFAVANGKTFFIADDGIHGKELWSSDGTTAGTTLVKDIVPGTGDSKITSIYAYNNKVYFFASGNNPDITQLWQSDGTAAGTIVLKDSAPILSSVVYTGFNNELYFTLSDVNGSGLVRNQLWKTDGTKQGTKMVVAINNNQFSWTDIDDFIIFNNRLYFTTSSGQQLWSTSGTPGDTVKFTFSGFDKQSSKAYTQIRIKTINCFLIMAILIGSLVEIQQAQLQQVPM